MRHMKLWLISQNKNDDYDVYDSAVVAANTKEEAKNIHPGNGGKLVKKDFDTWVDSPDDVHIEYLGIAEKGTKSGVILASFNAG